MQISYYIFKVDRKNFKVKANKKLRFLWKILLCSLVQYAPNMHLLHRKSFT